MGTKLYRVILPVTDIELSAEFYAGLFEQPGERLFYARDPPGNSICLVDDATLFTGKES